MLVVFLIWFVVIFLGFWVVSMICLGFFECIRSVIFLMFNIMFVIFLWILEIEENLCSMLLIWIVVIVVFWSEDKRIWCKELFKVRLKLCFRGCVINFVW